MARKMTPSERDYLKHVSRFKHVILSKYFGPWQVILGSAHTRLGYVDCFAGVGRFRDNEGNYLPGSPVIALRLATQYAETHPGHSLMLRFVERDRATAEKLRTSLQAERTDPTTVQYWVDEEDAQGFAESLVAAVKSWGPSKRLIPTFFFVDPYGHPITTPVIRDLLNLGQTEVLVNLMWYQISRDLNNPTTAGKFDVLFGHPDWRKQEFMYQHGSTRERAFMRYFAEQVGAKHHLSFPVPFSPEDRVASGHKRTKFCLAHFSNHAKAALLMKDVMSAATGDLTKLKAAMSGQTDQLKLLPDENSLEELRGRLIRQFRRVTITFDEVRVRTLDWQFTRAEYRVVLLDLEADGAVTIQRVVSKKAGLDGRDRVVFP